MEEGLQARLSPDQTFRGEMLQKSLVKETHCFAGKSENQMHVFIPNPDYFPKLRRFAVSLCRTVCVWHTEDFRRICRLQKEEKVIWQITLGKKGER